MLQDRHMRPGIQQLLEFGQTDNVVADPHKHTLKLGKALNQFFSAADDRPMTVGRQLWPAVIKETDLIPAADLSTIGNHLPVAAGTQHRKVFHESLPVNFDMVASRRAHRMATA